MPASRSSDIPAADARLAATAVVRRLRDAGHTAYFAGGCVRDALLGLHPTDYDVATDATPPRVRHLFKRTQEVGAAFGVVLVHVQPDDWGAPAGSAGARISVEVATFRADGPYTDARRPDQVTFSDPRTDAQRRDFTINALFMDPFGSSGEAPVARDAGGQALGTVIDFVGGLADLNARTIRAVGEPDKRLAEDHLRALRAVRFAARLGFAIEAATATAIRRHAAELRGVSRERIGDEMRRLLAHPSRAAAVALLQGLGLDAPVLDEPHLDAPTPLLSAIAGALTPTPPELGLALAAWATDRLRARAHKESWPSDADLLTLVPSYRRALTLSNDESDALRGILTLCQQAATGWELRPVHERKRLASMELFAPALDLLRAADAAAAGRIRQDIAQLAVDGVGLSPTPVLTGDDLVAAGYTPGPAFKGVLDRVYDAQLEGRIRDKPAAMELARRLGV